MFSGIVESFQPVMGVQKRADVLELTIKRPSEFNDLKLGDSVAVNGVCLTVEKWDHETMVFALGLETLRVTGWSEESLRNKNVNLERSLRFGDRIHGHLVSGHVEAMGQVVDLKDSGENRWLKIRFPEVLAQFLWPKGSITVNGVSLTVNNVDQQCFEVGLIPETLKRTNLAEIKIQDEVTLEADLFARSMAHWLKNQERSLSI